MSACAAVLRAHWTDLEADFQETYRIDLGDAWRGRLSLRRVWVLIKGLPHTSRFAREVAGASTWSVTDHLLAVVADRVAENTWVYVQSNSKSPVARPEPIPRPKTRTELVVEKPVKRHLTGKELGAWLRNET